MVYDSVSSVTLSGFIASDKIKPSSVHCIMRTCRALNFLVISDEDILLELLHV